jgi:hypothetical protein
MGFTPSKADYDLWMRARGDPYEYIAVIVDDLLIFSKFPDQIIGPLQEVCNYELKGVGIPKYYSELMSDTIKKRSPGNGCPGLMSLD